MLTYEEAFVVLEAARRATREESFVGAVAVVDARGHDLAVAREATASSFSAAMARAKARTSALVSRPSAELASLAGRYPEVVRVAGEEAGFTPVTLDGGVPLFRDGVLVGAIGVSGGAPEADRRCADAGARALSDGA